ncbi:MAG: HEPN domain-containing protein [Nitrososphaerota archaeon]|nr:HEPN domain-containing protein [Nitrososphaerota archaeon]MDG7016524.1 HEPN domain-containing protein [Nitrososphaerota archaeon]MDG7026653.1 HEPN domain-containing protein [Nitrososphaerota archaeon]
MSPMSFDRRKVAARAIARAHDWLQGASRALADGRWDDVVYSSQMAVEFSAKAVLLLAGREFPKQHDVAGPFVSLSKAPAAPGWFKEEAEALGSLISKLAELRILAGYSYETALDRGHFKEYAPEAFEGAGKNLRSCERLLREWAEAED